MLEVEAKYRFSDWPTLEAVLVAAGATVDPVREDTDHYFHAPDRDFARTDEAVRLRRIGENNYYTYKGPKTDTATKTRTEIELPLGTGAQVAAQAVRWLTAIGYKPVAVVSKLRRVYHLQRGGFAMQVCLDDVGAIGRFVELEIMAEPADFPAAKEVLLATAAEWGLTEQERRSYLRMLIEQER